MEKKLSSELIYQGKIINVYKDKVECENGNIATREVVRHHGGVGVLAVVDDQILLVKQYRYPNATDTLEIPAGKLELNEDTGICALRELEEETGYRAKNIKKIREVYPAIGYSNEKTIIFLAKDLVKTHRHLDETEDIEVLELPIEEVKEMLDNGEIKTSSEAVGLLNYFMYEYKK